MNTAFARLSASLVLYTLLTQVSLAQDSSPPNFLLLIGDDMAVETLDCYGVGSKTAQTPNIDRLCDEGVRFDNFWAQPVCSPTRATLLTGQFGFRNGVGTPANGPSGIDWAIPSDRSGYADVNGMGGGMAGGMAGMGMTMGEGSPATNRPSIRPDAWTMLQALKLDESAGYVAAAVGKWHLANDENGGLNHPLRVGFDHYAGNMNGGAVESYYAWSKVVDGADPFGKTVYATTDIIDDGIAWLSNRAEEPWLLWVAFNAPHTPIQLPPKDLLTSEEDLANTYVIFLGDNGTENSVAMPPFDSGRSKGTVYQGGVNVPFIVTGPGLEGGQSNNEMANSVDVFATILELAGSDADSTRPEDVILDSVSMVPILSGGSSLRDFNYADHFGTTRTGEADERAIRTERYKLVQDFGQDTEELFDLVDDPYEHQDLLKSELSGEAKDNYEDLKARIDTLVTSR